MFAYLLLMTSATRIVIGIYEIPSTALLAEFTQDYHERTELVAYRFFFGVVGGILMGIFVFTVILRMIQPVPAAFWMHPGILNMLE